MVFKIFEFFAEKTLSRQRNRTNMNMQTKKDLERRFVERREFLKNLSEPYNICIIRVVYGIVSYRNLRYDAIRAFGARKRQKLAIIR